jgi:hypothetical protein
MFKSRLIAVLLAPLALLAIGCAESGELVGAHAAAGMLEPMEASRPTLAESLFKEDTKVISNEDFAKILSADVRVPENAHLAVVRFGQLPYWWGWSENFVRMNQQIDNDFLNRLKQSNHLRKVSYLPSLVTPREMTIPYLRQAAARFQADALLIYRTSTRTYDSQKWFKKDESKAYCTVEAILLDTRSGVVPFSTVVTEFFTTQRSDSDSDISETSAKAEQQAIAKAWLELADQTAEYLSNPPTTRPSSTR